MEQKTRVIKFIDTKKDNVKVNEAIAEEMKGGWIVKQIIPISTMGYAGGTSHIMLLLEKSGE